MAGEAFFGLVTLGGLEVALPLSALREVVPRPRSFAALPSAAPGLVGAMPLRELIIPVVDLRAGLGGSEEHDEDGIVVVVGDGSRMLGMLADRIRSVAEVREEDLVAMTVQRGVASFSAAFPYDVPGGIVSVLDVDAVLQTEGVPTVAPPDATARTVAASGSQYTVLRCGDQVLAVDIAHARTTLPDLVPTPSVVDGELCRGMVSYLGHTVPVADPLVVLGLGGSDRSVTGPGLVLAVDDGYVVLAMTALVDMIEIAPEQLMAVPAFAVPRPDLVSGLADLPGIGRCLVLDGAAVLADPAVRALATTTLSEADSAAGHRLAASGPDRTRIVGGPAYLLYTAGHDVVSPLGQVREIVAMPDSLLPTQVGGSVLGLLAHRGTVLPVVALAPLLGRAGGDYRTGCELLLVESGQARVAFAIDGLQTIEPLTWQENDGVPDEQGRRWVTVGDLPRLLLDVDLVALAHEVCGLDEPAAASEPGPPGLALVG